jgi:hypothetical protein
VRKNKDPDSSGNWSAAQQLDGREGKLRAQYMLGSVTFASFVGLSVIVEIVSPLGSLADEYLSEIVQQGTLQDDRRHGQLQLSH